MKADRDFFSKTQSLKTPFIIYDLQKLEDNYQRIKSSFPEFKVFFVMKSNAHPRIISLLRDLGAGFETASLNETSELLNLKVDSKKIMSFHPIKSPEFLQFLNKKRIDIMTADSYQEIDKIAHDFPNAKIVPRVVVDNLGSAWQLNGKYGIEIVEFPHFFRYILRKGLLPWGLTFHVGSQCENISNWIKAIQICDKVWEDAWRDGIRLKLLSLGGGIPVKYTHIVPSIEKVGTVAMKELSKTFLYKTKPVFTIELGRSIVADVGVLVNTVFGTATRGEINWIYIETGTYNGLVEAIETDNRNFFPVATQFPRRRKKIYNIGGPTCVSLDTPFVGIKLPRINLGERVVIKNAGAYTTVCASSFNGFSPPKEYFFQDLN